VIVRWPTALITPSTSTALVLVAFTASVVAASVFAGAGAGAGFGAGAAAGAGFGAGAAGFSSTELQANMNKLASAAPPDQDAHLTNLFIPFPPQAQKIKIMVSRKSQRFLQLKTYFHLNCQGDGLNSALRNTAKRTTLAI